MKNLNMRRTAHEDLTPTQIISRLAALGAILTVGSLFIADYYNLFDKKKSQTSISKSFSDREKDPFSAIESQLNANKQRLTEEINSNFSDIVRVSSGPEDTLAGCLVNLKELLRKIMRNDPIDNDIMLGGAVISGGFESGNFNTTYLPDNTSFSSDFDTLNTSPLATKRTWTFRFF